jgi:hypothetical protein
MALVSYDKKDWLTLQPGEEFTQDIPHDHHTRWLLPVNGVNPGIGEPGRYFITYKYEELSLVEEIKQELIKSEIPEKIYVGSASATIEIEIISSPLAEKKQLLEKAEKYIKRSFSKQELSTLEITNGRGIDPYSIIPSEDQIITFLKCYTLAPKELQELLIKNSDITGFEKSEFVFVKLEMFDTPEAQKTREKMRASARIKYKDVIAKHIAEMKTEGNNDIPIELEKEPEHESISSSNNFQIIIIVVITLVIVCLFVLFILLRRK